jgi:hypothetical protein
MEAVMAMRTGRLALAALAAFTLATLPSLALAQGALPPQEKIDLTMEQKHVIKEIILKDMKIAPPSAEVPTQVGEAVPAGVPLQPIPVEVSAKIPSIKSHSFVVKNDTVLIVDPKDNKIAAKVQ